MNKNEVGKLGESLALRYVAKNGYEVVGRNQKEGFDEIDIIGRGKDGIVVFFEVKTIFNASGVPGGFTPEDHLTGNKLRRVTRGCLKFLARNQPLINEEGGWRIDLIAITLKPGGRYDLHHYKNI